MYAALAFNRAPYSSDISSHGLRGNVFVSRRLSHDARLLTKNTHIAMGTAVERQLTWATIDYLQAMQCDGKRKEKTFARLTQTGESFSLRLPSHWICGFRELS